MTLEELMDVKRFPLTTNPKLAPDMQLLQDAFNLDQLREQQEWNQSPAMSAWHRPFTEQQQQILAELEAKAPHMADLLRQNREREAEKKRLEELAAHPAG